MLSTLSSVDFAWVTAFTATGAAVAGYALGRLDRRRKRARLSGRPFDEKNGGGTDEMVYGEPGMGTLKRKLGVNIEASITVRYKRARADSYPTRLQTPDLIPVRRSWEEHADRDLEGTLSEREAPTVPITQAHSPTPMTPLTQRHTRTGLLTPSASSDHSYEDADPSGTPVPASRGPHLHSDDDSNAESDAASVLEDSDATIERVNATSELLHALLPTPPSITAAAQRRTPLHYRIDATRRSRPRLRGRALFLSGSKRVLDGYESGVSAPPSEDSDSDNSYHEGSDASSYDSRASSPGLNVPSDEETFWDGSDAESDADEGRDTLATL